MTLISHFKLSNCSLVRVVAIRYLGVVIGVELGSFWESWSSNCESGEDQQPQLEFETINNADVLIIELPTRENEIPEHGPRNDD